MMGPWTRSARVLALVGSVMSALTWLSYAWAADPSIGPNVNLTRAPGNQYETAVAVDPKNNQHIFVASRNEVGGLYCARSSDGGATWTSQLIATGASGGLPRAYGNASVAWDGFGNLFLVYLAQASLTAPPYVTLAVSIDGGASFHSPTGVGPAIILPNNVSPPRQGDQPTVAVGPGSAGFPGSVWVTYFSYGGIWVSGAGVSGLDVIGPFTSQPLPGQPSGVNFGDIAIGPDGEVMVTYGPDSGALGNFWIYTHVDNDGLGPNPFSAARQAVSTQVGGFLSIPAQPNWGIDPEAGLAYDRSAGPHRGRAYLVYTDTDPAAPANTDIFVLHSDDQGSTWSTPVRVNDDTGSNSQFLPRLSLDQSTGAFAVTWYDARNSAGNDAAQYFGAISTDGGATFGANFQIAAGMSNQASSTPPSGLGDADYGDYTGAAFVNGRLVAAWADNSNSTGDNPDGATQFDVYAAVVAVPTLMDVTPPAITAAANPSILWPPDGKRVAVTITGTMTDDLSGVDASTPVFVVSDSDGIIEPDGPVLLSGEGGYSFTVLLEASRRGDDLDGRTYTITVTANDNAGNTGSTSTTVIVPHDQR